MDFLVYNCRPTSTKSRTTKAIRHHLSKSVIINRKQLNFEIFVNNGSICVWFQQIQRLIVGENWDRALSLAIRFLSLGPLDALSMWAARALGVESVRFQRKLFTDRLVSLNPATVLAICICTIRNELRLSSTPIGLCKTSGPRRKFSDWIV